jgi:hypothetical protein
MSEDTEDHYNDKHEDGCPIRPQFCEVLKIPRQVLFLKLLAHLSSSR